MVRLHAVMSRPHMNQCNDLQWRSSTMRQGAGYIYSMVGSHERYCCITGPLCGESIGLSGYIYSAMSWEILFHCWLFVWRSHEPMWLHLQQEEILWEIVLLNWLFVRRIHVPKWSHLQHHSMRYCCIASSYINSRKKISLEFYCITGPMCGESMSHSRKKSHERYSCYTGPLCGESMSQSGYISSRKKNIEILLSGAFACQVTGGFSTQIANCVTSYDPQQQSSNTNHQTVVIVRWAGLLWSQQDFEWLWSVPLSSASLY